MSNYKCYKQQYQLCKNTTSLMSDKIFNVNPKLFWPIKFSEEPRGICFLNTGLPKDGFRIDDLHPTQPLLTYIHRGH